MLIEVSSIATVPVVTASSRTLLIAFDIDIAPGHRCSLVLYKFSNG